MRPLIGFTTYYVEAYEFENGRVRGRKDQDMMMSTMDYSEAVAKAGGVPVAISPLSSDAYLDEIIERIDGLLLTGGGDVDPKHYGMSHKKKLGRIEVKRDILEMRLLDKALEKGIPVLGICRGLQLINVYFDGTLIQDIPSEFDSAVDHQALQGTKSTPSHSVKLESDSVLSDCFESREIDVNSLHHQMIDRLGDQLVATAYSEDGVIEAIEQKDNPNLFAVQWHPEMMALEYPEQLAIFEKFVGMAKK